jgi:hypothetical protein
MAMIPKCSRCHKFDERTTYSSADDAAKQGAFERWTCPTCAWTEFELVDESEREPTPANA